MPFGLPQEILYVGLLFALVVAKVLQRWRLLSAITSIGLGAAAGLGSGPSTATPPSSCWPLASSPCSCSPASRRTSTTWGCRRRQHVVVMGVALAGVAWGAGALFGLAWRPALLVALALLTPSTGFILDSLAAMGLRSRERFWVKSKAIATEIIALGVLFVLQSRSLERFAVASSSWRR
jgi:Kef-type K+ transport system membrane component KefB